MRDYMFKMPQLFYGFSAMGYRSVLIDKVSSGICVLCILFIGFAATSCSSDTEEERLGSAMLDPVITIDPTVSTFYGGIATGLSIDVPTPAMMSFRLSNDDGRYAKTWDSVDDYPRKEPLRPGIYLMEAFHGSVDDEGFDRPSFYGSAKANLLDGQNYTQHITCTLANAVVRMEYTGESLSEFPDIEATLHSEGGRYLRYPADETRTAYMRPADIDIYLDLTVSTGEHISFLAATINNASAATLYDVTIDSHTGVGDTPEITVNAGNEVTTTRLTPEFIAAEAPVVQTTGITDGQTLEITEGDIPSTPTGFLISGAEATALLLSTDAPALTAAGWPRSIDLTGADDATLSKLTSLGMKITRSGSRITALDLTDAIGNLRSSRSIQTFSLIARSAIGKASQAAAIAVSAAPVDLSVLDISDVLMGVNIVSMKILSRGENIADKITVEILSGNPDRWEPVEILSATADEEKNGEWDVMLRLPELTTPQAKLRVKYLGQEKANTTVNVVSPEFTLEADAFAKIAYLRIKAERSDMIPLVTSLANIYVNGNLTQLTVRYPDEGRIIVGGLEENTDYTFTATLYEPSAAADHFTKPVTIRTERTLQLPDPSFEDVHTGLKYGNLPSGGRYSQNIVDIYNQQNYASYDYFLPKSWANVNAKTFCTAASNHNTWYMQPSAYTITDAMDGSYAVAIQTTAWDLSGQKIPDYRQTGQPYVNYSRNIPQIAHRAAGRLFLGSYAFNPSDQSETYKEGIDFSSRPTALNGYYRFIPSSADISDCGIVLIEVIGNISGADVVISRVRKELPAATGYTAFSAPLSYADFGVKAKSIRVLFASSRYFGSIDYESSRIKTYSDPVTSTSLGGLLWIDNITLSY